MPSARNPYLKDVDIYLINAAGTWSLLHPDKKLDPALADRVAKDRRAQVVSADGRYLTRYSGEPTAAATDNSYPVSSKLVIREITYDTGLARASRHPGLPELDGRAGAAAAAGVLDRLAPAAEAAPRPAVQPARRGRRHRRGRPRPGHRQHRAPRRDRPARQELRLDARRRAQDHPRPQGDQHLDRALRAARLPGDHRQAVDRRRSSSATTSART